MIIDREVEDFIVEHFGKKGMHWGVRNAVNATGRGTKRAGLAVGRGAKKTGQFVKAHPKAVTSVAASVAIGAAIAGRIISVNKATKVADIANRNRSEAMRNIRMLDQFREVKVRAIWEARKKGTISADHAGRLIALRNKAYVRKFNTQKLRL